MRRPRLDKIDRKILKTLQEDGKITNVELASKVGISPPPCLRRVRSLEETGYIEGYHARTNAGSLGYGITVFAHVKLSSQAEADLLVFEEQIRNWPLVRECHMLAGEVDFFLRVVARDWDHYQQFLTRELTSARNVISVKSTLAIRCSKHEAGVPIDVD